MAEPPPTAAPLDAPTAWTADELRRDGGWRFQLDADARRALVGAVQGAYDAGRPLLDYRPEDFDFGPAWPILAAAIREAYHGRGLALVHGLPRAELDAPRFALLSWGIGLHAGVARPQGKASEYLSEVRDAGTDYRGATGRGYSSNAGLDFHVDGADITSLACFNAAAEGGQTLVTSAVSAWNRLAADRPELLEPLCEPCHFSRQGEEAPDEAPHYPQPIADFAGGRLFMKWNRNRIQSAQRLDGVPALGARQLEAMERLDAAVRDPALMFTMYLAPGDLQIMNNLDLLHSRTPFTDHDDASARRLLHRLWLAPPDSVALPASWRRFYRSVTPGTVRGGIRGHCFDERCEAFDARQAAVHGMTLEDCPDGP